MDVKNPTIDVESDIIGEYDNKVTSWTSSYFSDATWYTITLTDENGNVLPEYPVDVYIPIPQNIISDSMYMDIIKDKKLEQTLTSMHSNTSISDGYFVRKNDTINNLTVAFMNLSTLSNIYDIKEDGIYTADAYFIHEGKLGQASMADAGLNHSVYIVVENGIKKMYFKSGEVKWGAYIGQVMCNNISVSGKAYENSISYTDFLTDENGNLVDNSGYKAISEYACIKGGILTLMNESYLSNVNAYSLGLVSPIMNTLSGTPIPYEEIKNDGLVVWLQFTNLKYSGEVNKTNMAKVNEEYGYKESAVVRQREIAKLKAAEVEEYEGLYEYPESAVYNLNKAIADADKATDSASYEKAIKALKTATEKAEPMTTSSIVNGYTLGLQDDFSLSFCMDFKSAAKTNLEKGTNTLQIILPDGETVPVDFSKAKYVEGQGYKLTADIAAKDVSKNATVQLLDKDGNVVDEYSYSVADYAEKLISTTDSDSTKELAQTMLNYGAYAQEYFGVSGTATADSEPLKAVRNWYKIK